MRDRLPLPGRVPLILTLALLCQAPPTGAVETPPPPPVLSPEEQAGTFRFAEEGYRIELVASDPMVQDPVVIRFDGKGRLWVVEMRGYMRDIDRSGVKDPIGRISVLEDLDGDGVMDRSTVFLDGLVLPRAISLHPDGALVAESERLWFVRDTDGDLVADRQTLVDEDYARDSIEHSANGLLRALDNRIYNAKEGHRYRREGDRWIREETEERGQWGICQDNRGRLFYNYNHSQLHTDLVPPGAFARNPHHETSTGLGVGVTTSNAVFPIRPTTAANRGYIPGALDEQGRIKEFTSACSPLIYRGHLFPEFAGNAFVCATVGNLVKCSVLENEGMMVTGRSAYPDRDFLASTDERFRPCWITEGPDGAIYIADMYRGVVQDGPHMSPYLREHSIAREMDRPVHLGRIWRIVPDGYTQPPAPDFLAMTSHDLVEALDHPGGWWRDQAQMHLVERNIREAIPALESMALENPNPLARLHAFWTLEGLNARDPGRLGPALDDPSPLVRTAALRILPALGFPDSALADHIATQAGQPRSEEDALQLILTVGDLEIDDTRRFPLLRALIEPRVGHPLMRDALLSGLAGREWPFLSSWWPGLETAVPGGGFSFLVESLAQAILQSRSAKSIGNLLALLAEGDDDWRREAIRTALSLQGPELASDPVVLSSAPDAADDVAGIETYFAWPGHTPAPPPATGVRALDKGERELFVQGRRVYLASCVSCHGADGAGMVHLAPPLAGSDWVEGNPQRLIRVLLHGLSGPVTVSGKHYAVPEIQPLMPPLASLTNTDIAAVLTYIRREWGNTADPVSKGAVSWTRIEAQGRTTPWTEAELERFAGPDRESGEKSP